MIVVRDESVWYTEEDQGTLGVLDPAQASGTTATLVSGALDVTPACSNLGAGTTATLPTQTGTLAWTSGTLEPRIDTGGFAVYELPAGSSPYGLAAGEDFLWVADRGRQKLLRIALPDTHTLYLPMVLQPVTP
jgi:streptogramin lyase